MTIAMQSLPDPQICSLIAVAWLLQARASTDAQSKLAGEKAALVGTVRTLNKHVAKLEGFKRNLLTSLQASEEVMPLGRYNSFAFCTKHAPPLTSLPAVQFLLDAHTLNMEIIIFLHTCGFLFPMGACLGTSAPCLPLRTSSGHLRVQCIQICVDSPTGVAADDLRACPTAIGFCFADLQYKHRNNHDNELLSVGCG